MAGQAGSGMNEPFFADDGPLVELTYDREGKPISVLRGKKRDREKDMEAMLKWMRALKAQISGAA